MNDRQEQIFNSVLKIVKDHLNPSHVILFGSRAKGKAQTSSSDFDFAIQGTKADHAVKRKVTDAIEKICGLYKVDIVYFDEVDEDFKNIILKTGKVIYERGT